MTLTLKACAKVNIGLKILGRRPDGYHDIHTVFQELDWFDTLTLNPRQRGWTIHANWEKLPCDETNTCARAYQILKRRFPGLGGVAFGIEKRIPIRAGLGGGSSDGAAALKGINRLYSLEIGEEDLEGLAREVGADGPFFIRGGTQLGEGVGDLLTPLPQPLKGVFLLVLPDLSIPTGWAYSQVTNHLDTSLQVPNFAGLMGATDPPLKLFENDFERIVIPAYPEIGRIKRSLLDSGARFASLSGSGSTVLGVFDDDAGAVRAESTLTPQYRTILATPTNRP